MNPGIILLAIVFFVALFLVGSMLCSVPQATVYVITMFGKYQRTMREGLNIKMPWESVFQRLSLQINPAPSTAKRKTSKV